MKKQRKRWSEEEDQFLRVHVNTLSAKEIAEQLDKSVHSVYTRIKLLDLKQPAYRKWTSQEDEYLLNTYGTRELHKIAKYLKREVGLVARRLERLGMANAKDNLGISTYQLAEAIQIDIHSIYRWMKEEGLPFKTAYAKTRTFSVIDVQEFWKWAEGKWHWLCFATLCILRFLTSRTFRQMIRYKESPACSD